MTETTLIALTPAYIRSLQEGQYRLNLHLWRRYAEEVKMDIPHYDIEEEILTSFEAFIALGGDTNKFSDELREANDDLLYNKGMK